MADNVDTGVQPVHPPGANPLLDCSGAPSHLQQLPPSDHPVLPLRKLSKRPIIITSPRKTSLKDGFRGLGGHPANVAGADSYLGRGLCWL